MKKGFKITLIIVGSLLGLILLATLLISPIAKNYVNNHGKELLGRNIHVEGLHVNVYTGHVAIHDLALYEEDDTTEFAGFDTLDVGVKLLKLLGSEVYVKHVTLSGFDVNVIQNGTRFNFTSLIEHFQSDEPKAEDTTASVWKLNFHDIAIRNSEVHYADLQRRSHWDLDDLNLLVPDFCIGGEDATKGGLSVALGKEGHLNADVEYDAKSNDFVATVGLKRFALDQVKPYLEDVVSLGEVKGYLGADLTAKGNLNNIMGLIVKGSVAIDGLSATDGEKTQLGSCRRIAVKVNKVDLAENNFDIASLDIDGLEGRFDNYPTRNTFSHLMPAKKPQNIEPTDQQIDKSEVKSQKSKVKSQKSQPSDQKSKVKSQKSKAMKVAVGRVDIKNTQFTYGDHTLPDPFVFPVKDIAIHAENVHLQGENNATINALLPNGGSANIRWKGNITDWKQNQEIFIKIRNLKLTELSPYLVAYLGQPFTDGSFSFTSFNRIKNSELDGKNKIDIYKADVGKRRNDVEAKMHLPLKAALYILKDKDDKIMLDVPVSGNIDKPEFNYMKLVWKTLGNLIVKVATSPIRALGDAMGLTHNDLDFIALDSMQFDFTSEQYYRFDELGQMLEREPLLNIAFHQQVKPAKDERMAKMIAHRNELLLKHFAELGFGGDRISADTQSDSACTKIGYTLEATLKEE